METGLSESHLERNRASFPMGPETGLRESHLERNRASFPMGPFPPHRYSAPFQGNHVYPYMQQPSLEMSASYVGGGLYPYGAVPGFHYPYQSALSLTGYPSTALPQFPVYYPSGYVYPSGYGMPVPFQSPVYNQQLHSEYRSWCATPILASHSQSQFDNDGPSFMSTATTSHSIPCWKVQPPPRPNQELTQQIKNDCPQCIEEEKIKYNRDRSAIRISHEHGTEEEAHGESDCSTLSWSENCASSQPDLSEEIIDVVGCTESQGKSTSGDHLENDYEKDLVIHGRTDVRAFVQDLKNLNAKVETLEMDKSELKCQQQNAEDSSGRNGHVNGLLTSCMELSQESEEDFTTNPNQWKGSEFSVTSSERRKSRLSEVTSDSTEEDSQIIGTTAERQTTSTDEQSKVEYPCHVCSKIYVYYSQLRLHEKLHTAKTCDRCGLICNYKIELIKHRMLIHGMSREISEAALKEVECSVCGHIFQCFSDMVAHRTSIHDSKGKYECSFCQKRFWHWQSRRAHLKKCGSGKKIRVVISKEYNDESNDDVVDRNNTDVDS